MLTTFGKETGKGAGMKTKAIITVLLIIAAIAGTVIWQNKKQKAVENQRLHEAEQREQEQKAPGISGNDLPLNEANKRPLAVMIENHPDSRPQAGLSDADIVYETLAEGGITRFLAIFQSKDPSRLGPVRSVRPYYALLADQWSPLLAHSGGSQTALQQLSIGYYRHIIDGDEMLNGEYYSRDSSKFAPHNLFTSGEKLRKMLADRGAGKWTSPNLFTYKIIPTSELKTTITEITIPFSTASFVAGYKFDPNTATYSRSIAGKPAMDSNNGQRISAKNVIVQFASASLIPDDPKLALDFKLDRSGKAYLFTGGVLVPGNWKYENGKTVFTDNSGKPLELQPGQTWIEIVPANIQNNVTWK